MEATVTVIQAGTLVIDRDRYLVTVAGHPVRLTYMEFNALWIIAEHGGRVVPYERLAEELWGRETNRSRRRLAVIVSRIRSKLGEAGAMVDTVTRVGYRLAPSEANGASMNR
jgi:two-component system, OmpR family, phosphate regulon response regulator PhoB